jgi:glutaconate CoA-transferase, subunit B
MQIDRHGNFNLHVIGDYTSPSVRMAGAYGSAMLYYMAHRVILFRPDHTRRTFVEKVDFVTAPGSTPESVYREGAPTLVVTSKAVLAWDKISRSWVLAQLHPGSSLDDVQASTGFRLRRPRELCTTPSPTAEELRTLRMQVKEKLSRIYPDFARNKIRAP